jgi:thiol-disulfide isomerase/thioredoxin
MKINRVRDSLRWLAVAGLVITLTACSRDPLSHRALADGWTVINYWATWCTPCIKEIPELNAFDSERQDVRVLGVNFDGLEGEELAEQARELGIAFALLGEDPSGKLGFERPQVLPTTVILRPGGEIAQILIGPQTLDELNAAAPRL